MRLIDADVFEREVMMMPDEELCEDCCYNVLEKLDDAPTVDLPDALRAAGWKEEGWVSVKDRMPDELDCYLVSLINHGGIDIDVYHPDEKVFSHNRQYVEYWMAIPSFPEPPEVSENG